MHKEIRVNQKSWWINFGELIINCQNLPRFFTAKAIYYTVIKDGFYLRKYDCSMCVNEVMFYPLQLAKLEGSDPSAVSIIYITLSICCFIFVFFHRVPLAAKDYVY